MSSSKAGGRDPFPETTPFFRTPLQMRILAKVLLDPHISTTAELGAFAGAARHSAYDEVARLQKQGVVRTEKQGRNVLVYNNLKYPVLEAVTTLLIRAAGPVVLAPELFKDVTGVDEIYIVGSWAARYTAHQGPAPADIDILLVGDLPYPAEANRAADALMRRLDLGLQVQILTATSEKWNNPENTFFADMQSRPKIDLTAELKRVKAL